MPKTPTIKQSHPIAHFSVVLHAHPENGETFELTACDAVNPTKTQCLFAGHIEPDMPQQLRALADAIESFGRNSESAPKCASEGVS